MAVKDLFDTAGVRTTYGSAVFADHVPATSAAWVVELEERGWVSVGKANLYEFALGTTSHNLHYGDVPNPRFPGLTAGGSSGGSAAAVALGEADVALGTDTGGSIRIPAACCGIVGFKPTIGLVPLDGVFPCAPSFDHAGPMARDVAGCIELLGLDVPEVALTDLSLALAWGVDVPVSGTAIEFPLAGEVEPAPRFIDPRLRQRVPFSRPLLDPREPVKEFGVLRDQVVQPPPGRNQAFVC